MYELRINRQSAMIGLNTTKASLELQTTPGKLEIETNPAQLNIQSPHPELHIDQSKCFADYGFKNITLAMNDRKDEVQSDYVSGLARIVSDGNRLAKIRSETIADVASSNSYPQQREVNVQMIPKQPPEITFEVHPVQINYQAAQVNINYTRAKVEANYQPAWVETYLLQEPFLKINWVGNNVDIMA